MADELEQDVAFASQLLNFPGWQLYYARKLRERFNVKLQNLALSKSDEDDVIRGYVQALNWAMTFPQEEIDTYNRLREEEARKAEEDKQDETRATLGYRSPYVIPEQEPKEH